MNRIWTIQCKLMDTIAQYEQLDVPREYPLNWERIHMSSCAKIGQLLALKRQVDSEMAAIACAIHDYGRLITGKQRDHAAVAYEPVKLFLAESGDFTGEEIETLAQAAKNHSNKQEIGTPLEEIVKDADVLDCYQYGLPLERPEQRDRLQHILEEFGLG